MIEDAEVGGSGDNSDDETFKKSFPSKKSNISTRYFISLCSDTNSISVKNRFFQ